MAHRALMGLSKKLPNIRQECKKPIKNLLVLDLEATCVENKILKPQEIIEFPCVVLSTEDWEVKDAFHEYVKPRVNPQLSAFCTELTGIMQETVEDEKHFPEVFESFREWLSEGKYFSDDSSAFLTCGDWDLKVMLPNQCKLDDIEVPEYMKEWINIKKTFFLATKYYPRGLNGMLKFLKMEFQGQEHCGMDDVHNIIRVATALNNKYKPEFSVTSNLETDIKTKLVL